MFGDNRFRTPLSGFERKDGEIVQLRMKNRNFAGHKNYMATIKDFASAPTIGVQQIVKRSNSLSYYY
jgi:hypothetical protein